ncbi:hypothetical protein [Nocardioides ungokensis]|uniref:hypothetical protein n=1 Tax=Nocardioides ungokensis TaxID=1643322 RepID=UPI0015DE1CF7|nr:hypothetical protein [Nocardioides ungokensis]
MTTSRFGRIQRATALVPLAMLSAAWTASVAGVGVTTASAEQKLPTTLPDGTTVPNEAIKAPASVSVPGVVAPGISGNSHRAVSTASTSGIPSAALAAYQRAETVINAADKTCSLPWQLVAAIGRVESDHGRTNGNHLDAKGIARPGIFGIPLDGTHNTRLVRDTDAGQYDADAKYDRAVGPMQFIPRPGRSWAWTPTATPSATRRTSTTRPWPRRSTSAPATTTSRRPRDSATRSTATTTASPTSTWCSRS